MPLFIKQQYQRQGVQSYYVELKVPERHSSKDVQQVVLNVGQKSGVI